MKKIVAKVFGLFLLIQAIAGYASAVPPAPSHGYLFAYGTGKNDGRNGLHYAWSIDGTEWHAIGPEYAWIKSDYSRWGSQKRMIDPFLYRAQDNTWHLLWSLNEIDGAIAHASSNDLIYWGPQSYVPVCEPGNCGQIGVTDESDGDFRVTWIRESDGVQTGYEAVTPDFSRYTGVRETEIRPSVKEMAVINGRVETGTRHRIPWHEIEKLKAAFRTQSFRDVQHAENASTDERRFAGLEPVQAEIAFELGAGKPISNNLIGVFFEDINYAADGGIYAELIQNRDFEYSPADARGWDARTAWSFTGASENWKIETDNPIHENNPHYTVMTVSDPGREGLVNAGFDGIALKRGEKYDFSFFGRIPEGRGGRLTVRLAGSDGTVYAQTRTPNLTGANWRRYTAVLTASADASDALLEIIPESAGTFALDMISLFPQKTFKGRKNGLRPDLAQAIADIKPRFVRFPGGCVAHGDGIDNIYHWKHTIGPLEARVPKRNLWGYHQTAGLGYFEYFQFCEDIGAEPVPVVAAGVPCQNSAHHGHRLGGQQCGIPMEEMGAYIQDILDLIEWANGDKNTRWGRDRARAGHPEPFGLKYLGIGNEDQITPVFEERYRMICQAVAQAYPEIRIIGTSGPFWQGTDYTEGWRIAAELNLPLVDEHYYVSPGWFIHNQDFYDGYDRSGSKVYLGEYASHVSGRHNNIETALTEALFLTAVERNGDIVEMTSYAPLLAKRGRTQWNPDLIYFDNTEVFPTVGYQVQKLFGNHAGDSYIPNRTTLSNERDAVRKRIGVSMVRDDRTGDLIVKLVNVLPVPVDARIALETEQTIHPDAVRTVLTGNPDDKNVLPVASEITVGSEFDCRLPGWSFTVIRIKTNP